MTSIKRFITYLVASILSLILVAIFVVVHSLFFGASNEPIRVVGFSPSVFEVNTPENFFYYINDELRHSDRIDINARVLCRGIIKKCVVSPDGGSAAIIIDGSLKIVDGVSGSIKHVVNVDSIYRKREESGDAFFRDSDFQWSKDSKFLYIIKDKANKQISSSGSRVIYVGSLFSDDGELWEFDCTTEKLRKLISPFRAYTYFFGNNGKIYFSVPNGSGDLCVKVYDGGSVSHVGCSRAEVENYLEGSDKPIFYSFSNWSRSDVLKAKGCRSNISKALGADGRVQHITFRGKRLLTLTPGESLKGDIFYDFRKSSFLPGDRFLLLPDWMRYKGSILVDVIDNKYMHYDYVVEVFPRINTETVPWFWIDSSGVKIDVNANAFE